MTILTESTVEKVQKKGNGVEVTIKTKKGEEKIDADVVLSAVGVTGNVEGIGLEDIGVKIERGALLLIHPLTLRVLAVYMQLVILSERLG